MSDGNSFVGGLATGFGVAAVVSLLINDSKNKKHQEELQQSYLQGIQEGRRQMAPVIAGKDMQIQYLNSQLQQEKLENARLKDIVENLSRTVKMQQLQLTAPVFSSSDENKGNSELN